MRTLAAISLFFISISIFAQESTLRVSDFDFAFRNVGPTRGGRVTAVAGVKSDPSTYYMGSTGGGVWKTTNYGERWVNISDGYFTTGSIGSIRVFQDNPDIIYVGTGSDGIRSNVIIGKGMFKSVDAGAAWEAAGLEKCGQIGAVIIDPGDADRVFAAAIGNPFGPNEERGVFRTVDGGKSWEKVLFISENTGACDLEFHPGNPDIIYASVWSVRRKPWTIISGSEEGGIYRSVDGGDSWEKLSGGLPQGVVGKSDLAVCAASPDMLYVLVEAEGDGSGLYISGDRGNTFKLAGQQQFLLDRPFYYTNIDVDPTDPDIIYSNSTGFYRSDDMGKTWERRSTPHGDNHDMWINPSNPLVWIQSNDGGANVTLNGGISWSSQDNQPTAELYQVNVDDQVPYWLYAGQQDNTTVALPSTTSSFAYGRSSVPLMAVGGCETGPAVPKPGDHNIVYSNCKGRFGRFNKITGEERQYYVGAANMYGHNPAELKYRFQRVSPILVSPHDPGVVYHASQYLHRTLDEGVTWETISPDLTATEPDKQDISESPKTRDITGEEFYSTIYAVSESPLTEGVIWTGANDGPVWVTRDNGVTWKNVTPPDLPPGGRVQTIEASPHNPAKAYFALYRYLLDDWTPYIFVTEDYGESWTIITEGIPSDDPARVIREDPELEGLLYAGTESGLYISFNDGANWEEFRFNFPVVAVTDIKIFRDDMIISTMGRSFWILDDISPMRAMSKLEGGQTNYLFKPSDRFRLPSGGTSFISWYLADDAETVTISISGNEGNIVFAAASSGNSRIGSSRGFHRFEWDMRSPGPRSGGRRGSRGPLVVPGNYRLTLNVDGMVLQTTMEVLPDPAQIRDGMSFADYREQYTLAGKIIEQINRAADLTGNIENRIKDIEGTDKAPKLSKKEGRILDELKLLKKSLVTADEIYPEPKLNDQLQYLYYMILSTDQKPGRDAYLRLDELTESISGVEDTLKNIVD